jgi:hypothetical protein
MALDTAIAPMDRGQEAPGKIRIFQRRIDFSATNLATANYFSIFSLDAGDVVLGGAVKVVTAGTATTDVTVGAGTGTELLTGADLDGTAGTVTPFTNTVGVVMSGDSIDVSCDTAAAVLGVIEITAIVLATGDTAG